MDFSMNFIKKALALFGAIGTLLGLVFFYRSKANTAEALNENLKTKEDLLKVDKELDKNNNSLAAEEAKRKTLLEEGYKAQNEEVTSDDVVDYFNNRK
jgi:hypothetical protein